MSFNSLPPAPSSRTSALPRRSDNQCSIPLDLPDSPVSQSSKCNNPLDFPSIGTPRQSMYPDSPSSLASAPENVGKSDREILREFNIPSCHVVLRRWKSNKDHLLENGISKCLFIRLSRLKPSEIRRYARVVSCEGFKVYYHSKCVKELVGKNLPLGKETVDFRKLYEKNIISGFHSLHLNRFKDVAQRSVFDFRHRSELKRKKEEELKQKLRFYYKKDSYVLLNREEADEKVTRKINLSLSDCLLSPDPMLDRYCRSLSREEARRRGMQRIYYTKKCYLFVPANEDIDLYREAINCCIVMNLSGSSLSSDSMHRLFDSVNDKAGEISNRKISFEDNYENMSPVPDSTPVSFYTEEADASLVERTKCFTDSGNFSLSPNDLTEKQESITEDRVLQNSRANRKGNYEHVSFDTEEAEALLVKRTKCFTDSGNFSLSPNDVTVVQESIIESEDRVLQNSRANCKGNYEHVSFDTEGADASLVERTKCFTDSGNFPLSPNDVTEVQESITESGDCGLRNSRAGCKANYENIVIPNSLLRSSDSAEAVVKVSRTSYGNDSGDISPSPNLIATITTVVETGAISGQKKRKRHKSKTAVKNIGDLPIRVSARKRRKICKPFVYLDRETYNLFRTSLQEKEHFNAFLDCNISYYFRFSPTTNGDISPVPSCLKKNSEIGDPPDELADGIGEVRNPPPDQLSDSQNLQEVDLQSNLNEFSATDVSITPISESQHDPVSTRTFTEFRSVDSNSDDSSDSVTTFSEIFKSDDSDQDSTYEDPCSVQNNPSDTDVPSFSAHVNNSHSTTEVLSTGTFFISRDSLLPSSLLPATPKTRVAEDPTNEDTQVHDTQPFTEETQVLVQNQNSISKSTESCPLTQNSPLPRNENCSQELFVNTQDSPTPSITSMSPDSHNCSISNSSPSKVEVHSQDLFPATQDVSYALCTPPQTVTGSDALTSHLVTAQNSPNTSCTSTLTENSAFISAHDSPNACSTSTLNENSVFTPSNDSPNACSTSTLTENSAFIPTDDSPNACSTSPLTENSAFLPAHGSPNACSTSTLTESDASISPYVKTQHSLNACFTTPVMAVSQNDNISLLPNDDDQTDVSDTDDYSSEEGVQVTDIHNFANGTNEQTDDNFFSATDDPIFIDDVARVKQNDSENDMDIQDAPDGFLACLEMVKGASDNSSSNTVIVNPEDGEYTFCNVDCNEL